MNELSLFSGAGGGLLATKWMLGWRTIGYVEWEDYCQKVIAQRIKDGLLDEAPIFGDIRTFISDGYAERYRGMVDVITAGFPCQPFSVAGKQKGVEDERNMWPATAQVIEIVQPLRVLLENVPGIRRYLPVVIRDLRRIGYEVRRPLILGADDVGAPHRRKRVWILATDTERTDIYQQQRGFGYQRSERLQQERAGKAYASWYGEKRVLVDPKGGEGNKRGRRGLAKEAGRGEGINSTLELCSQDVADTTEQGLSKSRFARKREQGTEGTGGMDDRLTVSNWWAVEPRFCRMVDGVEKGVE